MTAWVAADDAQTAAAIGVRLERLRAGLTDETLFIVPGMAGGPSELTSPAAAFTGPQEGYAVAPALGDPPPPPVPTTEAIAARLAGAIPPAHPPRPDPLRGVPSR